jgi:hypothetical protein
MSRLTCNQAVFYPDREPIFEVNGQRITKDKAINWLSLEYGPDAVGVCINVTSFIDEQDVFALILIETEAEWVHH